MEEEQKEYKEEKIKNKKMPQRIFDGMVFRRYRVCSTKKRANFIADRLRYQGFYVRLIGSRPHIEIWIAGKSIWERLSRW